MPRAAVLALALALLASCAATTSHGLRLDDPPPAAAPEHGERARRRADALARRPVGPDDVDHDQLAFTGADGLPLYGQRWRPPSGDVRAVLIVHHGFADHSARYAGLATTLARAGYAVYALDMRGHARSAGPRVDFATIDQPLGDLDRFVAAVRAREPDRPLFLFGHSVGGLITALYAIERGPDVAGVILSAPAIALDLPGFGAAGIRFAAGLAPHAPLFATPHPDFSTDPAVVADMDRDPLIHQGNGPIRTSRSVADGIARVWAHPERLRAPLLALHGTADKLTAPAGSRDLVARAGAADRTLRLYDGLAHDLVHEPAGGGARVAADLQAWLDAHTGGPALPFASSPPRRLRGDRRPMALAIELGVRGERAADATGATAGVRARVGLGRATAIGLGYTAGFDLRAGYLDGGVVDAAAYPLGLAARATGGASLALAGGAGFARAGGATTARFPVEASLDVPAGPVHAFARAVIAADPDGDLDDTSATVGLRLGADRRYWATVAAGAGPFVAVTYRDLAGAELWSVTLGGQLWGGN